MLSTYFKLSTYPAQTAIDARLSASTELNKVRHLSGKRKVLSRYRIRHPKWPAMLDVVFFVVSH